ncbi:MAG: T9SS type A sorting domain-containing protein [Prevotellaceae bacterium]|jgi:hypothetical protein|nr:T9SS type A sorting domain-containing protein [Prevotellaceae bacterium]
MKHFILNILVIFPATVLAQFDGIVGSEGCKAIHYSDSRFIEWATACEISRGYLDIARPTLGFASFGSEAAATGSPAGTSTTDAVSLGDGGTAIMTFETPIANGEGADFAVFENSFDDYFLELAFVEASSDGEHYFRFPAVSNTQTETQTGGFGTLDATLINNLAGKYRIGWGTPFDLEDLPNDINLDKNNITHVKIIDVVGTVDPQYATRDSNGNIVNDPYPTAFASCGFDLTGLGVIHNRNNTTALQTPAQMTASVYPNPCAGILHIKAENCKAAIYNALGQKMQQWQQNDNIKSIDMSMYPNGVYFVELKNNNSQKMIKITVNHSNPDSR